MGILSSVAFVGQQSEKKAIINSKAVKHEPRSPPVKNLLASENRAA